MTESVDCVATLCEQVAGAQRRTMTQAEILHLVDWVEKLTLRDLCMDYAKQAQRLYAEAHQVAQERTTVALAYAELCERRAYAYTQAAVMIHNTVESRWPGESPGVEVTPSDGHTE